MNDEQQISALIEAWARGARRDLAAVLADHALDIVMFDVPPPYQGRGSTPTVIPAPFFQCRPAEPCSRSSRCRHGRCRVAFAYALLRCGTAADLARDPEQRLRLTVGLRKTAPLDRDHEHHSFSDTTGPMRHPPPTWR